MTIGVELVTQPRLLFMDEPTSGLDASGALNVVKVSISSRILTNRLPALSRIAGARLFVQSISLRPKSSKCSTTSSSYR